MLVLLSLRVVILMGFMARWVFSYVPLWGHLIGCAKDNADFANGLTTEEKEVWDSASARTALEGGSTEKLYRAMMKKLKAKVKKQALIAA